MSIKIDDIAIIGMSGKFPGANSVSEFWDNLCAKKESIRLLSDDALRAAGVSEADLEDPAYVRVAAPLDDVDMFDAAFFRISPLEAELMDPQIRLLLQCAWETLEDAGHARRDSQQIGVFAGGGGVPTSYFSNFVNRSAQFEKVTASPTHLGNDKDFLATYLSYKLNLTGPSMTVQTACSTSLVALHQARLSLLAGECEMALAGGVSVRVPHAQGYHHKDGYIFSKSGRISTFDEGADGVVFGSGLGLVLIKRLAHAVRDGDHIYAVIKGSAIANDGKGKMSYAASSAKGQIACARQALKNADVSADSIGFVESHGTGTAMGDPEEVKALSVAFKEQSERKGYCALGAVKTNVGHLEAAAGIVGLIKAVLAVKHGVIPPTLHYSKPNPRIKFDNTPFFVNTELHEWNESKRPRRAAVNSLGVGGTNAFVILEEYVSAMHGTAKQSSDKHSSDKHSYAKRAQKLSQKASVQKKPAPTPMVVALSAKTDVGLRAYAERLAQFLDAVAERDQPVEIADLVYTLQTGREAMGRRIAFVVDSIDDLRAALQRYIDGAAPEIDRKRGAEAELAASWNAGCEVDWMALYVDSRPQRMSLPTTVFAKERYWIETSSPAPARAVLHPLLHLNTSDLNEQKYSTTFGGDEFFLKDHRVRTRHHAESGPRLQKVLPGVAYLEMARAAIKHAAPIHYDASVLEFRDVVWLQPITVSGEKQVNIAVVARDVAGQLEQRIDFEVYTQDDQIHCQGRGYFCAEASREKIDIAALKDAMRQGRWSAEEIYAAFVRMGLDYGAAHRPIVAIDRDEEQLLAMLKLPETIAVGRDDYVLHPSLFDGALQAATTLLFERNTIPNYPIVPFAMESLRIVAPCTGQMLVWARYAPGSHPREKSLKFDIDLLCEEGNICVQIRGFTARRLGKQTLGALIATQVWRPAGEAATQIAYAEQHVMLCGLPQADNARIAHDCVLLAWDAHGTIADRYAFLAQVCFEKLHNLMRSRPQSKTLLQVVLPNTEENGVYAGLSGLMKTARAENPQIFGQIVLVDADIDTDVLTALLQAERGRPYDTLIKYACGERFTSSWEFLKEDAPSVFEREGAFKDRGVYLITGGLGGLGALFAREILARTSQATVVLGGRASVLEIAESVEKMATLEALQAGGARVEYRRLNLDDAAQTADTIAAIFAQHGQINGILHSAGAVADGFILKKNVEDFRRVLAPKVHGTWHLDLATRDLDLDFMVLFSSLTAAVGNVGQVDYAAANGFMDEFAGYRNRLAAAGQRRGQTVAIRWPLWEEGGMQIDAAGRDQLHETTGIYPMRTATGLRMFYRSLAFRCDQTVVMEGDLNLMQRTLGIGAAIHSIASQTAAPVRATQTSVPMQAEGGLSEPTEIYLCAQLANLLKLPVHRVDSRAQLEDYGIDSILALDLTRMLEHTFGPLPKTLFFEYLTIRELAGYFADAHAATLTTLFAVPGRAASTPAPTTAVAPAQVKADGVASIRGSRRFAEGVTSVTTHVQDNAPAEPIAIVGLSGRYPESRDLDAFWRNLRDGKDCIVEIPAARWDWHDYYSEDRSEKGRHFSKWGGFIEGVDEFDARFFNISPVEAELIDPQERLFLQHAWMAIEDAGYTRAALRIPKNNDLPAQVGVYAGVMYGEYQLLGAEASLDGTRMGFASNPASIANRVSYFLNLHGPSMVVDTMCSSSLTAIHLACQDLKLGRTALGIAGGVNITIHPNKYLMLSAGQFISGDGHCQSFGEGGDGYIPGEGVGVLVLKRLSDARRDGNHIYGVIRGSALSHGGKTNGYTVPNPQAQASAVRQALAEAGVDPRHVSYIEAHGTGTKLGDPIEIAALSKVFRESTQDKGFCLIGSAKSNIGHAEAAAGIAGLTKVLLQLRHRQIVPSLHSSRLNPHIDFAESPFEVVQTLSDWERLIVDGRTLPRIAGISSFGAGGANAHLIVEEYAVAEAAADAGVLQIVPLSARTPEQLQQKAQDLLVWLRTHSDTSLTSLAYTLQIGREAMDERLALLVDSIAMLVDRLQRYLDGATGIDGAYAGQAKAHRDALSLFTADPDFDATLGKWMADRKLPKLTELWTKGLDLDWHRFQGQRPPLLTGLPAYPFARQRHWVDVSVAQRKAQSASALHPLLHANTSDFDQQRYSATFTGDEFFLADRRALGSTAVLEMVRAALVDALPAANAAVLELRDVAWASPAPAIAGRAVHLALFDRQDGSHGGRLRFELYTANAIEASVDVAGDTVVAQGIAEYTAAELPAPLDIVALRREAPKSLVDVTLPPALAAGSDAFALHPAVIDAALRAAAPPSGGMPLALGTLRLFAACVDAQLAWMRPAKQPGGFDLDLCTADGRIRAQLRDVRYTPTASQAAAAAQSQRSKAVSAVAGPIAHIAVDTPEKPAAPVRVSLPVTHRASTPIASGEIADGPIVPKPRGIVLVDPVQLDSAQNDEAQTAASTKPSFRLDAASTAKARRADAITDIPTAKTLAALDKPRGIALIALQASLVPAAGPLPAKPRNIALAALGATATARAQVDDAAQLALFDHGDGVFVLRLNSFRLTPALVNALLGALHAVRAASHAKVLLLSGGAEHFLTGDGVEHRDAQTVGLYRALAEFPYPVIAAARGDATGAGFLIAALCDALVCAESATYAFTDPASGLLPADSEGVLAARLGSAVAADFLYTTRNATGAALKAAGWTCQVLPADAVDAAAMALAVDLAKKTRPSLRLLKAHLGRDIAAAVRAIPETAQNESMRTEPGASGAAVAPAGIVERIAAHAQRIAIDTPDERTVVLTLRAGEGGDEAWINALDAALDAAAAGARGVVLRSEIAGFLPAADAAQRATLAERLRRMFAGFSRPLVAALGADTRGLGWYAALLCDTCIYDAAGNCDASDLLEDAAMTGAAAAAFALRHGHDGAHAWLLAGGMHSGAELHDAFGVLRVQASMDVRTAALAAVAALSELPLSALLDWKHRNAVTLAAAPALDVAAHGEPGTMTSHTTTEPVALAVGNAEITAIAHPGGILEVRMADREAKNMFSPAFTRGMREVFAHAAATDAYKVIVLTGYDHYFSSGGTRDTLLAIHDGSAKFTDNLVFQLPLTCPLPVIAAMQGHGIGAGWAMGMYADLALFCAESHYLSPYMGYGFTPGAGSTLMFPLRIGRDLACETLLTAQDYAGADLKARGLRQPVLPREEVLPAALALAHRIACQPRARLLALKQRWAAPLRALLDDTYARELDMHAQTFVGQVDTLARIQSRFAANSATAASPAVVAAPTIAAPVGDLDASAVAAHLRSLLAHELRMELSEIGDDEQFVDLGLDSITGVTWIRRINEHYGTAIEAIKVYSYPTLAQLARHLREEIAKAAPAAATLIASATSTSITAAPTHATPVHAVPSAAVSAMAADPSTVAAHLRSLLAHELRMELSEIGDDEQFVDLGLDSITGVTWIRRINEHYGTAIEAIKVYSYPTLAQLARHVREEAMLPEDAVAAAVPAAHFVALPVTVSALRSDSMVVSLSSWRARYATKGGAMRAQPIAVIGMAGQFAKANDLDSFWRNIAEGRDCIDEIPAHRWDIDRYFQAGEVAPGKTYSRWMGALEEYDRFDAAFFNISPREARSMDPQQRVFLQACWHSIEHAGYDPKSLAGQRCGVFVGCSAGDYHQLSRRERLSGQGFTGAAPSILAARISYLLDLHGPSLSIDTACSSSLVAIATACDSLLSGGSDMAIAGGVNVMAGPAMQIMTAQVGMLSPQGRCFTFDERANGIANGEGVGVIVLKRLADAERDRDRIYGVVEGWGTNQDGKTNGITAPNADSQTRLQRQVYDRFGIDPAGIQLIEAHGTGTALGDPIEVAGLKAAFKPYTQNMGYCALGSVKTNIGHCLTAAGVSGVLKVLLALQHRQLPPTIHFRKLNQHIALDGSPFYVNGRMRDWTVPAGTARRAAVNAFGFSGTNGHLVIAEYNAAPRVVPDAVQVMLPLSARTPEQLLRRACELLAFLDARQQNALRLDDIAYTLQTGREAMNERLAILAGSVTELKIKLRTVTEDIERVAPGEGTYRGQVSANRDTLTALSSDPDFRGIVAKWIARRELPRLADLWAKGLDLPWDGFYAVDAAPQRLGLPGYPFAKERHWLEVGTDAFADSGIDPITGHAGALHPLLHANSSDLAGQRYDARFGDDAFHLVVRKHDGESMRTLSAAACLEMARAAVVNALPDTEDGQALELRNLRWGIPLPAAALRIAVSAQDNGSVAFDIVTADDGIAIDSDAAVLCQGEAVPYSFIAPLCVDLPALRARMRAGGPDPQALYARFAASGVNYGNGLRGLHALQAGVGEWLAEVRLPADLVGGLGAFHLHPTALEVALQVGIALIAQTVSADVALAPTTIDSVLALAPCAETLYAWARLADAHSVDIDLCDGKGTMCVQIRGLRISAVEISRTRVDTVLDCAPAPFAASSVVAIAPAPAAAQVIALDTLQQSLRESLADALFMQPGDIDVRRSFTELGLDSIIGVEWVKAINRRYGSEISATRVYDYPSVTDLAVYLHAQLIAAAPATVRAPAAVVSSAVSNATAMPAPLVTSSAAAQVIALNTLQQSLRESLADALFMQPGDIDVRRSFTELGLDSIIGVEWVKAINRRYGSEISATRVYDYPSVTDLAVYLHAQLIAAAPVMAEPAPFIAASTTTMIAPVPAPRARAALVGRGARFSTGIRFAPKFGQRYKTLYFHAGDASGDIDTEGEFSVHLSLSPDTNVSLREHVVFGEHLLPTDAYLELVHAAYCSYFAPHEVRLERIAIANPLLGAKGCEILVRISFRRSGEGLQFFVRSSRSGDFEDAVLHLQGMVMPGLPALTPAIDADFAVERRLAAADIPTNAGVYYAPLRSLRMGETRALGEIVIAEHDFAFVANPLALYGGLCTAINFAAHLSARDFGVSDDQFLPYRIGMVAVHGDLSSREYLCRAEARSIKRDVIEFAFVLIEANGADAGRVAVTVEGLELRRVPAQTIRQQATTSLPAAPRRVGTLAREDAVAIVGMSCRYPMSETADAFWDNLRDGRDCVSEIPAGRWGRAEDWYHPDPRHPHTSYSKWAGLLDNIDAFDALFFGISPVEAESIDPQQRVFLEECWKSIESAGYAPGALSGQACGVYVGCAMGDYGRVLADEGQDTLGAAFMGTSTAILSARISYFLNLKGAALAIDTACSSSLVAVHLACESIRSGENRLALAGGINLLTTPLGHILTSQVGMPSRDGRCATFDASANGIVFSEGCGVLLLKSLADAERDSDGILGVIRGSGTNQDGKTNGITAPSAKAQEQLLRQIYDKFDIDPARISYVEAHGTATPLGDPIEVDALTAVFGNGAAQRCALGSVKSNIGHTGFAAGVAGIVKVLLCMKHRTLVPSIHYRTPNPHIDFDRSPFRVNTETCAWDSDIARMATVSSFGFSGTNAHVVIEEHLPTAEAARAPAMPVGPVVVPLSARTDEQLQAQARDLLAFLRCSERPLDLACIAYTLQVGREAMPHRLAVITQSHTQLQEQLQSIVHGAARIEGVYRGVAERDDTLTALTGDAEMRRVIDGWIVQKHLPKVLDLWVRGLVMDWTKLHTGTAPRRMSLPTYPFARERCWVEGGARRAATAAVLHPLLHRNVSDLGQQRYASVFAGTEFFLADHRVNDRAVLPAVAYLEMARAALHDSLPSADALADVPLALELRHIVWAQPIVAEGETRVGIAVFADGPDRLEFEVTRQVGDGRHSDESMHCQGSAVVVAVVVPEPLDIAALRIRMQRGRSSGEALYPQFAAMGLHYGSAFQGIVALERGDDEVLVELALPASARSEGYVLHPSLADSALQGSIALTETGIHSGLLGRPALPFALESLRVHASCEARMFAWVRYAPGGRSAGLIKIDIDLCTPDGRICAQMRGFSSRPLDAGIPPQLLADSAFDEAHYLSVIDDVLSRRLSADEAVELG